MRVENIELARQLFESRKHILDVIEALENEEITFCNECGQELEAPDGETVNEIINIYKGKLAFVDSEIEKL